MVDYRLDGLSPRSFEHLVQALAFTAITNEITPFGDGPDGGREATFDGDTGYGSDGNRWNGYGVLQAKFRQKPGSDDGGWIVRELRKELAQYRSRNATRRIPKYYIIATNVVLTPTARNGSKDRVLVELERFKKQYNLTAFDVWDYDKIRVLLDSNEEVRRTYRAWVTSGDILSDLAQQLRPFRHDYYKIIVNLLQKDLLGDQFAKLEQAGHSADEAIRTCSEIL